MCFMEQLNKILRAHKSEMVELLETKVNRTVADEISSPVMYDRMHHENGNGDGVVYGCFGILSTSRLM